MQGNAVVEDATIHQLDTAWRAPFSYKIRRLQCPPARIPISPRSDLSPSSVRCGVVVAMGDWNANQWDDDGDGWEDVAAVPSAPTPALSNSSTVTASDKANGKDAQNGAIGNDTSGSKTSAVPSEVSNGAGSGDEDSATALSVELAEVKKTLGLSERRVVALTRERDALRRARDTRASTAENSKEKDKQIAAVLEEGQKLSVKVAEAETAARAAKFALKEKEAEIEEKQLACNAAEAKVEALAAKNRTLETSEKAALESKDAAERRLRQMESDLRTKSSSSAALDAARSQLEALRKSHTAALENQAMRIQAEADGNLEKEAEKYRVENETLNKAIAELRAHLSQVTDNAGWKEDQLRKEASELRTRAKSLEARNEELAQAVPGATRPLLRQVEALQAAASERERAVSAVERSQLERLRTAESSLAAAGERERAANTRISSLLARIASVEEQVKLANAETARVGGELRAAQSAAAEAELEHRRHLDSAQVNTMKAVREKESLVDELSKARAAHLDDSEATEERERKMRDKLATIEAQLEASEKRAGKQMAAAASATTMFGGTGGGGPAFGTSESMSSLLQSPGHRNLTAFVEDLRSPRGPATGMDSPSAGAPPFEDGTASAASFAESSSAPGGVYDTERLQISLRQYRDEIDSLQGQLSSKETATQALADEVVMLTGRVEELSAELQNAPRLREELQELKVRHETLLILLGEKEEKIQEVEADLQDVTQISKQQITELLLRLESKA